MEGTPTASSSTAGASRKTSGGLPTSSSSAATSSSPASSAPASGRSGRSPRGPVGLLRTDDLLPPRGATCGEARRAFSARGSPPASARGCAVHGLAGHERPRKVGSAPATPGSAVGRVARRGSLTRAGSRRGQPPSRVSPDRL